MENIELSTMLMALREELGKAQQEAEGKDIKFVVNDVELELQLTVSKDVNAKTGVKFLVFNAEAGGKLSSQSVQKIKLKLTPETGSGKPVKVSDTTTKPK